MNGPVRELDIGLAVASWEERRAKEDAQASQNAAKGIADLLISGCHGGRLNAALHDQFPTAPLSVVYYGVSLAITAHQADLALAKLVGRLMRAKLAEAGIEA